MITVRRAVHYTGPKHFITVRGIGVQSVGIGSYHVVKRLRFHKSKKWYC